MNSSKRISFESMRFGNERELDIALTELRWIKKVNGKLRNSDFKNVSQKYCFPIDFLRKGIEGFSYPEDFLVSKSKWFPILYAWVVQEKQYRNHLYKLQFDYLRTKFIAIIFLGLFIGVSFNIGSILQSYFSLDLWQTLNLAIAFILSFIGLYVELRNNLSNCRTTLDEYSTQLKELGLSHIIRQNEEFIQQHYSWVIYAGNTLLKKIRESTSLTLIYMGMKEEEKKTQPTRFNRILRKIPLYPKTPVSPEKEKIPIFYAENPFVEYKKRVKGLIESK